MSDQPAPPPPPNKPPAPPTPQPNKPPAPPTPPPPVIEQRVQAPAVGPSTSLPKEMRTNLINRRSVAWILEFCVWHVIAYPIAISYYLANNESAWGEVLAAASEGEKWYGPMWIYIAVWLPYFLLRDQLGQGSWGKKLVGLKVVSDDGTSPPPKDRAVRNILLAVPLVPLIEFFVAKDAVKMKRMGDKMASTYVTEIDPANAPKGSWSGKLVLAFIVGFGLVGTMESDLIEFWLQKFL